MRSPFAVLLGVGLTCVLEGPASAQFHQVDPTASFYHTCSDSPAAPLMIPLSAYVPGSTLTLTPSGLFRPNDAYPLMSPPFSAVFSSSATLLSPDELNRVPGALISDAPSWTPSVQCLFGGQDVSIPQAFGIFETALSVTIPDGATTLFIGISDGYLADNSTDNPASFGVTVSTPTTVTPEPVSMALLGTGLLGVGVVKRRRKKERALA